MTEMNRKTTTAVRRFTTGLAAAVLGPALFFSCSTLPRRQVDVIAFGTVDSRLPVVIEEAEITTDRRGVGDDYPFAEMTEALWKAYGPAVSVPPSAGRPAPYRLTVRVREKELIRNLTALYSVTAQAVVTHPETGRAVIKIIYHEETPASLESYYQLYSVIKTVVRKTAHGIKKHCKTQKEN